MITTTFGQGQAGHITLNANPMTLSSRDWRFAEQLQQFGREIVANESNGESSLFTKSANGLGDRSVS